MSQPWGIRMSPALGDPGARLLYPGEPPFSQKVIGQIPGRLRPPPESQNEVASVSSGPVVMTRTAGPSRAGEGGEVGHRPQLGPAVRRQRQLVERVTRVIAVDVFVQAGRDAAQGLG